MHVASGDGTVDGASDTAEIYEPPYLLQGRAADDRDGARRRSGVGSGFGVQTRGHERRPRPCWWRRARSRTRVDMNQRVIPLPLTKRRTAA